MYLHKKSGNRKPLYLPLQTSCTPAIRKIKVEKVDDSPGTFICTLIPLSDTRVHQTSEQQTSSKPSRNCVTSSPDPNKRGMTSSSRYALERRARVCDCYPGAYFPDSHLPVSKIAHLEKTVQGLAESQSAVDQEKDHLNEAINSLRTNLRTHNESSSTPTSTKAYLSLTSIPTRRQNHTS